MKCLILGGNGFLGSHLRDLLLREGNTVRILDRQGLMPGDSPVAGDLDVALGDFANRELVSAALHECDVVYHLVSTTLPQTSNDDPAFDVQSNLGGTLNMLEAASGKGVRKIIFVSSGGTVYGIPQRIPLKESDPTNPICSYGITKLAIEKYLHLYKLLRGLDYCVLRLANPFGERQPVRGAQGAVAVFLHKAASNQEIEIWGDGSIVRDYIYVGDAIAALSQAKGYEGEERIFNIGSGQGRSLNEVLAAIEAMLGRPVRRRYLPGRAFDVPGNVLDISRARAFLGWTPKINFEDGLSRTWKWLLTHQGS
jgi:UDP-glucose 4-epimerase